MDLSTRYKLLAYLETNPEATQRELAREVGISLGKLNYCLRSLIAKGWIKAGRFYRNPDKRNYAYLLTPQGIEAKARVTADFLQRKTREYDELRQQIENLTMEVEGAAPGGSRPAAGGTATDPRPEVETAAAQQLGSLTAPPLNSSAAPFASRSPLPPYRLHHLGGEKTVTGSCHLLQAHGVSILVDCGLAQGGDPLSALEDWPVRLEQIDYLFLTHAHLDHAGRLPELLLQGFRGEILLTHATRALLRPMLADAMALKGMSEEKQRQLLARMDELSRGLEYGREMELRGDLRARLGRAGHILGSCFIRFEGQGAIPFSIVFSGDLGASGTPLLPDPDPAPACDLLVLESTYGDRNHEGRHDRLRRLGATLSRALADRGKVFIPAFALGRTQELLYELDRLLTAPEWRAEFPELHKNVFPVVVDSPLGLEITEIYGRLRQYWNAEATDLAARGDNPLDFKGLYSARDYRDHLRLAQMEGPCVILAGSGMCTGGRIVDHLLAGLAEARNDLIFVGYQAQGTPGREILWHAGRPGGYVYLDGQRCEINAQVHTLGGYSAHADQQGLLEWVESMPARPGAIKLVHGEPAARQALAGKLRERGYVVSC